MSDFDWFKAGTNLWICIFVKLEIDYLTLKAMWHIHTVHLQKVLNTFSICRKSLHPVCMLFGRVWFKHYWKILFLNSKCSQHLVQMTLHKQHTGPFVYTLLWRRLLFLAVEGNEGRSTLMLYNICQLASLNGSNCNIHLSGFN